MVGFVNGEGPHAFFSIDSTNNGGPVSYSPGVYWNSWENTHMDEFSQDTRMFTLDGWTRGLSEPFATYSRQEQGVTWGSDAYFELGHTPGVD